MTYDVYHIQLTPADNTTREIVVAMLAEAGFDSFEETDAGCDAYVDKSILTREQAAEQIASIQLPEIHIDYTVDTLKPRDWNEQWEQDSFRPIIIPQLCAIHRPDQEVEAQPYDILVNPRMAFGSGTHETTIQLVELLLQRDLSGLRCLDIGCGTGILAICMSLAHAAEITAIDIDAFSVVNARENAQLNDRQNISVLHGDASSIAGPFDLIVANIHRNIILQDLPTYVQALRPGGQLIVSGFFTDDIPDMLNAAIYHGLKLTHQQDCNSWAVLVFSQSYRT